METLADLTPWEQLRAGRMQRRLLQGRAWSHRSSGVRPVSRDSHVSDAPLDWVGP